MTSRDLPRPSVVILVADGVRPDTLAAAMDAGALPALKQLRAEGGLHRVTTVFPSVTGPAYAPFLMGRYPGPVGLPALRWFDRQRTATAFPHRTRSYVGSEMRKVDRDLDPLAPTIFELATPSLAALSVIGRGVAPAQREGNSIVFALRAARTHFSGNVRGWLDIDRDIGAIVARRIAAERPSFTFCALTGIDKTSHAYGHGSPHVVDAMKIVDETAGRIRRDAERDGRWATMQLWIVSDHGHSPVRQHDDLAALFRSWNFGVRAHPWVLAPGHDIGVMVSGNAMAHLYFDLRRTSVHSWDALSNKWSDFAERVLARRSVDLMLLSLGNGITEIRSRDRGTARITELDGRFSYRPLSGDPLGVGSLESLSADGTFDATIDSDYPDAIVQIAKLMGSARSGEMILSAARDWDFRGNWEPIPHVSSHGALHRDHMIVPLLLNRPASRVPRRTVDIMPSALAALGIGVPAGLDGISYF
jgi:arylsulfatase A-like enzyme